MVREWSKYRKFVFVECHIVWGGKLLSVHLEAYSVGNVKCFFVVCFLKPTDEFSDLPLRVAEITKEQRLRRENQYQENRGSSVVTNGGGKQWSLANSVYCCHCWQSFRIFAVCHRMPKDKEQSKIQKDCCVISTLCKGKVRQHQN